MAEKSESQSLEVDYEGDFTSLDVFTLIYSLGGTCEAICNLNRILHPDSNLRLEITSTKPGSFHIHLFMVGLFVLTNPLFGDTASHLSNVLSTFVDLLELRRFLGGKKPKEIRPINSDQSMIINQSGDSIVVKQQVINIHYHYPQVSQSVSKAFKALDQNPSIEGYSIKDETGKTLFHASRHDFYSISTEEFEEGDTKTIRCTTTVRLVKIAFEPQYKWVVVFQNRKISVSIKDEEFYKRIESGGITFRKGDALEVELEIKQVFDPEIGEFIEKDYTIIKVYKHIPAAQQLDFGFHFGDKGKL